MDNEKQKEAMRQAIDHAITSCAMLCTKLNQDTQGHERGPDCARQIEVMRETIAANALAMFAALEDPSAALPSIRDDADFGAKLVMWQQAAEAVESNPVEERKRRDNLIRHIDNFAKDTRAALPESDALQSDLFYMQDSRFYVGNDVLWWAKDGKGYTTDLSKAEVYDKEIAVRMHEARISDIPWPKAYIDAKTRPAVDMQYIKRNEALAGAGIVLRKPERDRKEAIKCEDCGSFMNESQLWSGACPKCGADNRP